MAGSSGHFPSCFRSLRDIKRTGGLGWQFDNLAISKNFWQNRYSDHFQRFNINGNNNFLAVFKESLSKTKNLFLLLGGLKAEDMAVFTEAIKHYGLTADAALLPHLPFNKVKEYYAISDIFVLPYAGEVLRQYSLSPIKLFEYAACNRPIICPATENLAEIFNAEEVVFYKPDNYNELGEKILLLAKNQDLRLRFAERALAKAGNYSWQARAAKITAFIQSQLR